MKISNPFFSSNDYFIDEKFELFKLSNTYKLYNGEGVQIGNIVQKIPTLHKLLRFLLMPKSLFPFLLEIKDMNDNVQVKIHRGWTFWMTKVSITDKDGHSLGKVSKKFTVIKPVFEITDNTGNNIAKVSGDWLAWDFSVVNADGQSIGSINKKWAGAFLELFTDADKYHVSIAPGYAEDFRKIAILASAITIDMVLKEQDN